MNYGSNKQFLLEQLKTPSACNDHMQTLINVNGSPAKNSLLPPIVK